MKSQDRRVLVFRGLVLLSVLLAGSGQAASLGAIAEERLEPSQLVLEPLLEFEQGTLTVEGPAGYLAERAFAPGEAVRLALRDGEGHALPDGRYRYSLRLSPSSENSSDVQKGLFFIDEGSGVSRTEKRDRLASIRETLNQERQRRLQVLQQAAAISRDEVKMTVTPPYSYALSIDGDFALGGYVFKEGLPFIHNYGGFYYGNTALGLDALVSTTLGGSPPYLDGSYNTAVGQRALQYNTTGYGNTATGYRALNSNTTGWSNTAIGDGALFSNTIGRSNTAIGEEALYSNTTGRWNTASGSGALLHNTIGNSNTAIGLEALAFNTTGSYNAAIGDAALVFNTTGYANTACGSGALILNTTGSFNTASGSAALLSNITGSYNTASGDYALWRNTTGSRNLALGNRAGYNATTGDDNIFIANSGVAGESGSIRIGTQGTQSQTYIAGIYSTVLSEAAGYVVTDADGQLGVQVFVSSHRFKEDVDGIGEASERLLELRPVKFRFKEEFTGGEAGVHFGLIAEEVADVIPELVTLNADGRPYAVKYRFLPTLLLNELQKQARRLHGQERLLAAQEQQLREQQETLQAFERLLAEERRDFERLRFEQRRELETLANRLARLEGSGRPSALEARRRARRTDAAATP